MARQKWTHVDSPEGVGSRLKEARESAGLSQRELAFPGCSPAYISRIEAGARVPSLQLLTEIARRLAVPVQLLATGAVESDLLTEAELALRFDEIERAEHLFSQELERGGDARRRARALAGLGQMDLRAGELDEAIVKLAEARALLGPEAVEYPSLVESLGKAYAIEGRREEAIAVFEAAAADAAARENRPTETRFLVLLANALIDAGSGGRAAELLARVLSRLDEIRDPILKAKLYWSQSRLQISEGRTDLAARYAERALATVEVTEDAHYAARAHLLLAYIEVERGNGELALEHVESAQPLIDQAGDRFEQGLAMVERARALVALERLAEARDAAEDALVLLPEASKPQAARAYATLGDVFAAAGDSERAIGLYEIVVAALDVRPSRYLTSVYGRLAELLEQAGRADDALRLLKRAIGADERSAARRDDTA